MKTIRYDLADGIATITFDEQGSPVNTMCADWHRDFTEVTAQVLRDKDSIKGIILASAKTTFFAGADLKSIMRNQSSDAPALFREIQQIKKNIRTLETLGKPVVACINGAALGGGWEMALIAHHRVAVNDRRIQLGLPEITLGLIPGASGITKMTRLLGLLGAQPYILESRLFSPGEALELGLVHELVDQAAQLRAAALAWIGDNPSAAQPWDQKDYRIPGGSLSNAKTGGMLSVAPAMLKKTTRGNYPAPEAALAVMVEGLMVDYDTALRIESRYLASLAVGPVAKNMINTFFFNMNAIKRGESRPKDVARYKPARVGLLGAGMMGAGIAYAQASRGVATVLKDVSLEQAEKGKVYSLKLTQARVNKGKMSPQDQAALLSRIQATDQASDLQGCDLIIEAVFENRELKAQVTKEAEPMLAAGGFFASNTSTLPISGLAKASARPEKFVGIHFFSPVDKMKLVEIIRGRQTDDETVARAFDYVQAIGKIPIVVNDSRGFFTSRVFGAFVMEGIAMLGEGMPAAVIENGAIQAGMPVGPLAVVDETSLSLSVHVMEQTKKDMEAEGKRLVPSAAQLLVQRMAREFKRSGRASGGGFYDYPQGEKKRLWPELKTRFERADVSYDMRDVKDRILYRQSVETARALNEKVLTSVHDANIGSIFGIGFPGWTGGAMQFIYGMGIEAFARRAGELAARYGDGFTLSPEVLETIRQHQPVY